MARGKIPLTPERIAEKKANQAKAQQAYRIRLMNGITRPYMGDDRKILTKERPHAVDATGNDRRDRLRLKAITKDSNMPEVRMHRLYRKVDNEWKVVGHQCQDCGCTYQDEEVVINHKYVCKRINTR